MQAKKIRRPLDGVLLIDKPKGPSSQQVVSHCRWLFNAAKAGHGGTLDPLATGLMVIAFGEATKFLHTHLEADKTYLATLAFGSATDTADAEGVVIARSESRPTEADLTALLPRFLGEISQMPPIYSALKIDGKPAYERARAGELVQLKARPVLIKQIELVAFSLEQAVLRVHCGKGTYIRSLARDIGEVLGCLAHLSDLRREGTGGFNISQATALDSLQGLTEPARETHLLAPDCLLTDYHAHQLNAEDSFKLRQGQAIDHASELPNPLKLYDSEHKLLGIAQWEASKIKPTRLISTMT
jgi:tRNA pseudouridine55 synthase